MPSPFLTAAWRYLAMLNYEVDPAVLKPFVPAGTELDLPEGRAFVSVVGFHFRHTRVRGVPIPFHEHFEEVNLRFYVRRTVGGETRRGVVFIKELVPRWAIAWTARRFYNENYFAVPMHHQNNKYGLERSVTYGWKWNGEDHHLEVRVMGEPVLPAIDSFEAFITEHYWGYARQRNGGTMEYQVEPSALAGVGGSAGGVGVRCGGALRQGVRAVFERDAGVGVFGGWVGGGGLSGGADLGCFPAVFFRRTGQRSCRGKCVPKCNLGTRSSSRTRFTTGYRSGKAFGLLRNVVTKPRDLAGGELGQRPRWKMKLRMAAFSEYSPLMSSMERGLSALRSFLRTWPFMTSRQESWPLRSGMAR
jgi:uncharacterized protein YqjF (DUF2071 family)